MIFIRIYRIGMLLCLLLYGCFPKAQAQISDAISKHYPDSLKPADPRHPTSRETARILVMATFFVDPSATGELDTLARSFEQSLKTNTDKKQRIAGYLALLNYYWNFQKIGTASILTYCDLILKDIGDDKDLEGMKWETEGYVYTATHNYEETVKLINKVLAVNLRNKDSVGIADNYITLSHTYAALELFGESIYNEQMARHYLKQDPLRKQGVVHIDMELGEFYLCLFAQNGRPEYLKEATTLFNKVIRDSADQVSSTWLANAYAHMSWACYLAHNFKQSIIYTDAALGKALLEHDPDPELTRGTAILYKGLSLFSLGQETEAATLLKEMLNQRRSDPNYGEYTKAARTLYHYAKEKGSWKEALDYLEQYKAGEDSLAILSNRGKVFAVNQRFNVAQKQTEINALENQNRLKDQRSQLALLSALVLGLLLIISVLVFYNRQRRLKVKQLMAEKAIEAEKQLRDQELQLLEGRMLQRQNDAIIAQRKQISEDMHDDLSSALAGLRFYVLDMKQTARQEESQRMLEQVEEEVNTIYLNARQYMHHLNTNTRQLQYDLVSYLEELQGKMASKTSLALSVQANKKEVQEKLTVEQHYQLYHILREAIANIIKHARASQAAIQLAFDKTHGFFSITDNGQGFNAGNGSAGLGLSSMDNRIRDMHGSLQILSQPGKGTTVKGQFRLQL